MQKVKKVKWAERDHSDGGSCDNCDIPVMSGERGLVGAAVGEGSGLDTWHPFIIHTSCKELWQSKNGYVEGAP